MKITTPAVARRLGVVGACAFVLLTAIGTATAFTQENPLLLVFSGLMVIVFPGLSAILGLRNLESRERGWIILTLSSLASLTLPVIWLGVSGGAWAVLSLPFYLLTLLPFVVISREYRPEAKAGRSVWYPVAAAAILFVAALLSS